MLAPWILYCLPLWAACASPAPEVGPGIFVEPVRPAALESPQSTGNEGSSEDPAHGSEPGVQLAKAPEARASTDESPRPAAVESAAPDVVRPPGITPSGDWLLELAENIPALRVPRNERLVYSVVLDFGFLGEPRVGSVALESRVDRMIAADGTEQVVGFLGGHAKGGYLGFSIDNRLGVRLIDQLWPRMDYSDVDTGTGPHMRTLKVGESEGEYRMLYQYDGHCKIKNCRRKEHMKGGRFLHERGYHCPKCRMPEHRTWRDPFGAAVPLDSVDMVSAVYLVRSAIDEGLTETTFHLIENDDLWTMTALVGRSAVVETGAGRFAVREVKLVAKPAAATEDDSDFKGMFGLHGSIELWFHEQTGVPVSIRGTVPVGPLSFEVRIELEQYSGTPEAFRPV